MGMTDPISDMFTRIRNGLGVGIDIVEVPYSSLKERITKILHEEGFIEGYKIGVSDSFKSIFVHLKYRNDKKPIINQIKRISKPGCRVYMGKEEIPFVRNGFGIAIVSTSKGVMTNVKAKKAGLGGELLATIW